MRKTFVGLALLLVSLAAATSGSADQGTEREIYGAADYIPVRKGDPIAFRFGLNWVQLDVTHVSDSGELVRLSPGGLIPVSVLESESFFLMRKNLCVEQPVTLETFCIGDEIMYERGFTLPETYPAVIVAFHVNSPTNRSIPWKNTRYALVYRTDTNSFDATPVSRMVK